MGTRVFHAVTLVRPPTLTSFANPHRSRDNMTYSQLQKTAPDHPYVQSLATLDAAFDRLQTQFASHIVPPQA